MCFKKMFKKNKKIEVKPEPIVEPTPVSKHSETGATSIKAVIKPKKSGKK